MFIRNINFIIQSNKDLNKRFAGLFENSKFHLQNSSIFLKINNTHIRSTTNISINLNTNNLIKNVLHIQMSKKCFLYYLKFKLSFLDTVLLNRIIYKYTQIV